MLLAPSDRSSGGYIDLDQICMTGEHSGADDRRTTKLRLGQELKARRMRAGLSQGRLAALSGISVRSIRALEAGSCNPREDTVRRLAEALRLDFDERCKLFADCELDDAVRVADPEDLLGGRHRALAEDPAQRDLRKFSIRLLRHATTVDRSRRIVREHSERILVADEPVSEVPCMISVDSTEAFECFTVDYVTGGELSSVTRYPEEQVIVVRIALPLRLPPGTPHLVALATSYRFTRGAGALEGMAVEGISMVGTRGGPTVLAVVVEFDPCDPPARCEYVFERHLDVGDRALRGVAISGATAQLVVAEPRVGYHGLRWEW